MIWLWLETDDYVEDNGDQYRFEMQTQSMSTKRHMT